MKKPISDKPLKIAVIGGGIAGIMSAYLLQEKHDVTIFESNDYLGGHANPVRIDNGKDSPFDLDTAFLVFNNISYPMFLKFLKKLNVDKYVDKSEMSFSFSDESKNLHFSVGKSLSSLFYQKNNLVNPDFYRMFKDLLRFRKKAYFDLINDNIGDATLEEYLKGYSKLFKENMISPTAVSVWSLPRNDIWNFPAKTYINFQNNHNYLKGFGFIKSGWYTFKGSSSRYLESFKNNFNGKIYLQTPIKKVIRSEEKVELIKADGSTEEFDKVIFATHADITLKLLENPSEVELKLLGVWKYHTSRVTLHTDENIMYPDKKLWASWNVKIEDNQNKVTYYLNRVQSIKSKTNYFLTFSDGIELPDEKIIKEFNYAHPVYDSNSIKSQDKLQTLNGYMNSYFCGSYFGYGFHEDAIKSAIKIAHKFGIEF